VAALYRYWAAIVFLAVLVQIGLAGYGAFYAANKADDNKITKKVFEHGFDPHVAFGYIVVLGGILLLLIALAGRLGRPRIMRSLVLAVLLVIQVLLAYLGYGVSALGFLHPLNAFAVFGLSGAIVHGQWRSELRRSVAGEAA
jgi:hypothetical protein